MKKPHANNTLATLPAEDQQRLLDWKASRTFREVLQIAAQPRPEGLGLKTSLGSLSRFIADMSLQEILQARCESSDNDTSSSSSGARQSDQLESVLLQTMEEKALHELLDPDKPLTTQSKLANTIIRLATLNHQARKSAQKEQALELQRQARQLASQQFTFQSVHLLRQQFPFPDQIDLDAEARDLHTISRLFQTVLQSGNLQPKETPSDGSLEPSTINNVATPNSEP